MANTIVSEQRWFQVLETRVEKHGTCSESQWIYTTTLRILFNLEIRPILFTSSQTLVYIYKGPKDSKTPVLREFSVHLNGSSNQKENKPISDDCITVMKTKPQSLQARSKCGQCTEMPAHGFETSNRFDALNPCANVC